MQGTHHLRIRGSFAAAHRVCLREGEEPLHGHTYQVEAVFAGAVGEGDMVADFRQLKALLGEILEGLDHSYLNDLAAFAGKWPTAEMLAVHICAGIAGRAAALGVKVEEITVWESERTGASFRPS
jgi:6-pyruvoyltetrahydropterin/6-carboxytetrahydropterin synthase